MLSKAPWDSNILFRVLGGALGFESGFRLWVSERFGSGFREMFGT